MRFAAWIVCGCFVAGCGKPQAQEKPLVPPPGMEDVGALPAKMPSIKQTEKLQELGVLFSSWEMESETSIVGIVEPTKRDLKFFHLAASFYDTKGVKVPGAHPSIPSILKPGEKGKITLNLPIPANQISRIAMDER